MSPRLGARDPAGVRGTPIYKLHSYLLLEREGCGFQAVQSGIGYMNRTVLVGYNLPRKWPVYK